MSEQSRCTAEELASVIGDLAEMTTRGAADLRAYTVSLTADGGGSVDDTARKASAGRIEQECGIEVGELLPTDTG